MTGPRMKRMKLHPRDPVPQPRGKGIRPGADATPRDLWGGNKQPLKRGRKVSFINFEIGTLTRREYYQYRYGEAPPT